MRNVLRCLLICVLVFASVGCGAPVAAPTPEPVLAAPVAAPPALAVSEDLAQAIDFSCQQASDCAIKNVGNCCGYFPACVNQASPTFPEKVLADCAAKGMTSICGFPEIAACSCVDQRCEAVSGAAPVLQ